MGFATSAQRFDVVSLGDVVTDDFIGLAAHYAEAPLKPLWDAWLYSTGVPPP